MTNLSEIERLLQNQLISLNVREEGLHKAVTAITLNKIIQEGLNGDCLKTLEESIPRSILAAVLDSSPSRLKRLYGRKLPIIDADRLYALIQLWPLIMNFFDNDKDAAEEWLLEECPAIDGAIPAKLLATSVGRNVTKLLITRMSYGEMS
ncbi:MAG: hypothetical protein CL693_00335 [Cellvibrionaceae bacterium]|nr:hypothetical protein [Cellvibrionaceae bacterium]|tara:strand:- start:5118 stop:5567 length:450 start_codon:yes stop_codon:yes gene_type:complete